MSGYGRHQPDRAGSDGHAQVVRGVPRGADGAVGGGLLAAAGVDTRIDTDGADRELSEKAQRVLAWTIREGVTNLLRHSEATTCTITPAQAAGVISLDIRNDGVRQPLLGDGSGLAGLKNGAADAGGWASGALSGGDFDLRVELPETNALADRP